MTVAIEDTDLDARIHNTTPEELWAMSRNKTPIQVNWLEEMPENLHQIHDIMDLTGLTYADVEGLLYEPHKARLCDIKIYCHALKIDMVAFIQKSVEL